MTVRFLSANSQLWGCSQDSNVLLNLLSCQRIITAQLATCVRLRVVLERLVRFFFRPLLQKLYHTFRRHRRVFEKVVRKVLIRHVVEGCWRPRTFRMSGRALISISSERSKNNDSRWLFGHTVLLRTSMYNFMIGQHNGTLCPTAFLPNQC